MKSRSFWIAQNALLIGLYAAASWFCMTGNAQHRIVWVAAIVLIAHILEIPVAFRVLRDLRPAPLRTVIGTFLFGFTYWLPVKRGVYAARGATG